MGEVGEVGEGEIYFVMIDWRMWSFCYRSRMRC